MTFQKCYQKFISIGCAVCISALTVFSSVVSVRSYAVSSDWSALGEDAVDLYNSYLRYINGWSNDSMVDIIGGAVDIPVSWYKVLEDGTKAISPVDDWYFYLTEEDKAGGGGGHVRSGDRGGGGGSVRPASEVAPVIPSDTFKDIVTELDSFYSPSGDLDRISWQAGEYWNTFKTQRPDYGVERRFASINLIKEGRFRGTSDFIYLCPYYYDGQNYYYGNKILYLYFSGVVGEAELYYKVYNGTSGTASDPVKLLDCFNGQYMDIGVRFNELNKLNFCYYDSYENYEYYASYRSSADYCSAQGCGGFCLDAGDTSNFLNLVKSTDSSIFDGRQLFSLFDNKDWNSSTIDYGFVYSDAYFAPSIGGYTDIDSEKILANTTVTITGDTIGDYTYTDNTTGDTTTIKQYITNNYTYPDSGGGSDPGGSGSSGDVNVGGNVTVGGNVAVGGQIDIKADPIEIKTDPIDINVNVSGGVEAGGGSGGEDSGVVSPDISGAVDYLPENTDTMKNYFSVFFDFLPPEMLALLLGGLACAILCRALGR